jgi:hypothetical protein
MLAMFTKLKKKIHKLQTKYKYTEGYQQTDATEATASVYPKIKSHGYLFPKATRGFEPISYRGALLSTLLHATVHMFIHS